MVRTGARGQNTIKRLPESRPNPQAQRCNTV